MHRYLNRMQVAFRSCLIMLSIVLKVLAFLPVRWVRSNLSKKSYRFSFSETELSVTTIPLVCFDPFAVNGWHPISWRQENSHLPSRRGRRVAAFSFVPSHGWMLTVELILQNLVGNFLMSRSPAWLGLSGSYPGNIQISTREKTTWLGKMSIRFFFYLCG